MKLKIYIDIQNFIKLKKKIVHFLSILVPNAKFGIFFVIRFVYFS